MGYVRMSLRATMLAGSASRCLLLWQPATAQTPEPAAASSADGEQLEEIIVTARKREEDVQTVPIAVSVTSGQTLAQHQVTDLYALQKLVPSLGVGSNVQQVGEPTFAIRGIQ